MKTTFYPDELLFIRDNFNSMTNGQLLSEINSRRKHPITLSELRHQYLRMNLSRGIQIRWSHSDTQFLIENYKQKGNKELAILLTERKKTSRVINGKKVFRKFTKKHVEKKMILLALKRTEREVYEIKKRNIRLGISPAVTSTANWWSKGVRIKSREYETRIWNHHSCRRRFIKVNDRFIPYTRWFYENYIGPVPPGYKVYHIDMDSINDDPSNLQIRPAARISLQHYQVALPLITSRIKNHLKTKCRTRQQEVAFDLELIRLRRIQKNIENKIDSITCRKKSKHLKRQLNTAL